MEEVPVREGDISLNYLARDPSEDDAMHHFRNLRNSLHFLYSTLIVAL
jgi:hypothetical protein